jgi:hypothetical protein
MSAEACVAFFGVRHDITIEESEDNNDPRIQAARKVGLQFYSGNFGGLEERYLLFIGSRLGILGAENSSEVTLSCDDLQALMESTKAKLQAAGLPGDPSLYFQWEPDT